MDPVWPLESDPLDSSMPCSPEGVGDAGCLTTCRVGIADATDTPLLLGSEMITMAPQLEYLVPDCDGMGSA